MKKIITTIALLSVSIMSSLAFSQDKSTVRTAQCLLNEHFSRVDVISNNLTKEEIAAEDSSTVTERSKHRASALEFSRELELLLNTRSRFLAARQLDGSDYRFYSAAKDLYPDLAEKCNF